MSTHTIDIIEIGPIEPHPNADRLELTHIMGWQCCIGKGDFKQGDRAIYIPPDYVVPFSNPLFKFLDKGDGKTTERIRVRKYRGLYSQGLLVPVPEELKDLPVGANVIEQLGIVRYEPPLDMSGGQFTTGPSNLYTPKFDVENMQSYMDCFVPGEEVVCTEKIHGGNARFSYAQDADGKWQQFCGSRTNWMADDKNFWWIAYHQNASIGEWCRANPEKILYGEVFGNVQSLKYSAGRSQIFFAAFGILEKHSWLDYDKCIESVSQFPGLSWVPLVYRGPFDFAKVKELAEGNSLWPKATNIREGVVVIPVKERVHPAIGRVCLKVVSNKYLETC